MVLWSIKYISENPDAPGDDKMQTHTAHVYAKTLAEALDKIEKLTGGKITAYGFNFEELKNGVK